MARSPAFQLNVSDFRQDPKTIRMNTTEIGAYFLLLLECWDKDNRLPADIHDLADIARLPVARFQKIWKDRIERCFLVNVADQSYSHKRLEKEIRKQDGWSKVMSDAGKKGAAKRWGKKKLDSQAIKGHSHPIASDSPTVGSKSKNTHTHNPTDWIWPMRPLIEAFPDLAVTPTMIGFIEGEVKHGDESAWADTIQTYLMNHNPSNNSYMPEKTGTLLSVFKKKRQEIGRMKNGPNRQNNTGNGRQTSADRLRDTASIYDKYPSEADAEA